MTENNNATQELTLAQSREATYRFLASMLFKEVTVDFLKAAAENPPVTEGALGQYFASLKDADLEKERSNNAVWFAKLLLNASPNPVIAYESPYTSAEHLMKQQSYREVKALFATQGFKLVDGLGLPEDHISFELEFMAHMCRREQELLEAMDVKGLATNRAIQRAFLTDHLLAWGGSFCEDMAMKSRNLFYVGIADTLGQFLAFEIEDFDIKEEEIKYPKFGEEDKEVVRAMNE